MREFELLGPNEDKPNPLLLERLRACCQVVNALGYKVCVYISTQGLLSYWGSMSVKPGGTVTLLAVMMC